MSRASTFIRAVANPTRAALERTAAELESGTRAFAYASGMAAVAAVLDLLPANSHVIVPERGLRRHLPADDRCAREVGGPRSVVCGLQCARQY